MLGLLVNKELEKILEEAVVTWFKYRSRICMEGLRNETKSLR